MAELRTELNDDQLRTAWGWIGGESYWAKGMSWPLFERACRNSLCFGMVEDETLEAFARVVTDQASFAWLCDVFVSEDARGKGHGKALMDAMTHDPRLQNLRRWSLATSDAHGLYRQYGFEPANAAAHMERLEPGVYARLAAEAETPAG